MMFKRPDGLDYLKFLEALHADIVLDWYMEIGCRNGHSFGPSRSKTVAVDPFFKVKRNVIGDKPALHVLQTTSDDFFASGFLKKLGIKPAFSFLDGMHLFEFLLRDFINTEANSRKDCVIALHDCCPSSFEMTTRDLDNLPYGDWTGDVWKVLVVLREYRPDLKITVLDCAPTGLVLVSNLSPTSQVLKKNYDAILAKYRDIDLQDYGPDKFYANLDYTSAQQMVDEGFPLFAPLRFGPAAAPAAAEPSKVASVTTHDVTFVSSHPTLNDFATDLARGVTRPLGRPVEVFVGAHLARRMPPSDIPRLGIQTEQLMDADGTPLWKAFSQEKIARIVKRFDAILDLSPANRPAYEFLPKAARRKVHFGPHIFPETAPAHRPGGQSLIFVGSQNPRRAQVLAQVQAGRPITILPEGTFGTALDAAIQASGGMLNIHYQDGIYTEYPRLLKTLLNGKICHSEAFDAPLQAGTHYLPVDAHPDAATTAAVYDQSAHLLTGTYALHPFLAALFPSLTEGRP